MYYIYTNICKRFELVDYSTHTSGMHGDSAWKLGDIHETPIWKLVYHSSSATPSACQKRSKKHPPRQNDTVSIHIHIYIINKYIMHLAIQSHSIHVCCISLHVPSYGNFVTKRSTRLCLNPKISISLLIHFLAGNFQFYHTSDAWHEIWMMISYSIQTYLKDSFPRNLPLRWDYNFFVSRNNKKNIQKNPPLVGFQVLHPVVQLQVDPWPAEPPEQTCWCSWSWEFSATPRRSGRLRDF